MTTSVLSNYACPYCGHPGTGHHETCPKKDWLPSVHQDSPLAFTYRNHRGEVEARRVRPIAIFVGSSRWHPERRWLLKAFDLDRDAERDFAMKDIVPTDLHDAGHAALYAMRLIDEEGGVNDILSLEIRTALARAHACLEAALLGKPKPCVETVDATRTPTAAPAAQTWNYDMAAAPEGDHLWLAYVDGRGKVHSRPAHWHNQEFVAYWPDVPRSPFAWQPYYDLPAPPAQEPPR